MSLLNVSNLSVKIETKLILEDINFNVEKGEALALLGHNGAGKSTLMQAITGLRDKHTGTITLNDYDQEDILNYKENFVYLPEEPLLLTELTVMQHFQLYGKSYQIPETELMTKVKKYTEGFELVEKLDEYPGALSKGMRQKVQTICAFLPHVPLLLIDEPFMGLDVYSVDYFLEILAEKVSEGTSIIITTHQLERVSEIADKYIQLQNGKIIEQGSVEEFLGIKRGYKDD